MANILRAYTALSTSSTKSEVSTVLQSIINAPPFTIDASSRIELIKSLLRDLTAATSGSKPISSKEAAQALLAVKELGKNPAGSEFIGTPTNLRTLLSLASAFKDDEEATSEALRCIANALFLIEKARSTILDEEVDGGNIVIWMLEKTTIPDHIFVLSRILFLATVPGPRSFILHLVEDKFNGHTAIEIIGSKLDILTVGVLSATKMAKEAMTDILKFAFNLLLYYPKFVRTEPQNSEARNNDNLDENAVIGDFWSSKLDGLLAPALRVFTSLPPTSPSPIAAPVTHVIHTLITIPITADLRSIWFGNPSGTTASNSNTNSPKNASRSHTPQSKSNSGSRHGSPGPSHSSPPPVVAPKPSTLDRALSVLSVGRRSLSRSPPSNTKPAPSLDVLQHAYDLLDNAFTHFFPESVDVDDASNLRGG
ncbi:hypothetical protein H0H93_011165 [Arthromyces matolae]|nr:hypothetical protein H0H93_011165 [Arthromyces matolae]